VAPVWHNGLSMRAICAWCKRDGHAGLLGDREPLDDPAETHGICPHHRAQLLREFYGRPGAGARLLFVIAPNERKLYDYLSRSFAGLANVEVIMERRRRDRRREARRCATERRATERRMIRGERYALGYQTIRFTDDPERPTTAEAGHRR
jgi:hypothetical protein